MVYNNYSSRNRNCWILESKLFFFFELVKWSKSQYVIVKSCMLLDTTTEFCAPNSLKIHQTFWNRCLTLSRPTMDPVKRLVALNFKENITRLHFGRPIDAHASYLLILISSYIFIILIFKNVSINLDTYLV